MMDASKETYSAKNVKKSFVYFSIGKVLSMIVGFSLLIVLVRFLTIEEFAFYMILLALIEIIGLGSNFGLLTIAQRYIPELEKNKQYIKLRRLIISLTTFRLLAVVIVVVCFSFFLETFTLFFGFKEFLTVISLYCFVFVFENINRFIDLVFESLMLQKISQSVIFARNLLRLLLVVSLIFLFEEISLEELVKLEIIASIVGFILAMIFLVKHLFYLKLLSVSIESDSLDFKRYFKFAKPTYIAQLLYLATGADVVKLFVSKIFGSLEVAVFSFSFALMVMVKRFSPAFLIVGIVRPLLITAYNADNDNYQRLNLMLYTLFKLNMLYILPLFILFSLTGDTLVSFLSAGKITEGSLYLALFTLLVFMQVIHVLIGIINMANEGGKVNFIATLLSVGGLLVGLLLIPFFEEMSLVFGMLVSELIWVLFILRQLIKDNIINVFSSHGLVNLVVATVLAFSAGSFFGFLVEGVVSDGWILLVQAFIVTLVFFGYILKYKVFSHKERTILKKVLPVNFFPF